MLLFLLLYKLILAILKNCIIKEEWRLEWDKEEREALSVVCEKPDFAIYLLWKRPTHNLDTAISGRHFLFSGHNALFIDNILSFWKQILINATLCFFKVQEWSPEYILIPISGLGSRSTLNKIVVIEEKIVSWLFVPSNGFFKWLETDPTNIFTVAYQWYVNRISRRQGLFYAKSLASFTCCYCFYHCWLSLQVFFHSSFLVQLAQDKVVTAPPQALRSVLIMSVWTGLGSDLFELKRSALTFLTFPAALCFPCHPPQRVLFSGHARHVICCAIINNKSDSQKQWWLKSDVFIDWDRYI